MAALEHPKYAGLLPRADCEQLLGVSGVDEGDFLVRLSSSGGYALSVRTGGVVKHCKIEQSGDRRQFWVVPDSKFGSVEDLLSSCYEKGLILDQHTRDEKKVYLSRPAVTPSAVHPVGCPRCQAPFDDLIAAALHMPRCTGVAPRGPHDRKQGTLSKRDGNLKCLSCLAHIDGIEAYAAHTANCTTEPDKSLPTQAWACPAKGCAMLNKPYQKHCPECNAVFPAAGSLWTCRRCMCANPIANLTCKGCDFGQADTLRRGTLVKNGDRGIVHGLMRDKARRVSRRERANHDLALQQRLNVEKLCSEKEPFVSPEFPCNALTSLYINGEHPASLAAVAHHWRRAQNIVGEAGGPAVTVMNEPRSTDIIQGQLGNCWFVSALSVVAEKPGILERVLVTKQPSAKGVYQVMLFSAGEWEPILLDDTFPCSIDGRLAYTSAKRNQLWAPLIEKAAASLYGSYEALQAGSISEGLRLLTGSPCETVYLDTSSTEAKVAEQSLKCVQTAYDYLTIGNSSAMDDLWIKISSAHAKGCLMGASTKFDCPTLQGLVAGHAYSVMNVWNPAGRRLICLRNPHGGESWTGPWGAKDKPEWTAALKAQVPMCCASAEAVGVRGAELGGELEGVFWMSFPDFVQHFVTVDVCHIKRNWSSVRLEGKFPQTAQDFGTCFQVRAFQETALNITLSQTDIRGREHAGADAEPLDLGILVLYTKRGDHVRNSKLVGFSARRIHPSRMCETYLKHTSGTYIVIPISFNHFNYGRTGSVNRRCICDFHSANTLTIEAVTCPPDLLAHAVILQAIECGKCLQPFPAKDSMKLYELDSQFVVDNGSKKRSFATHLQVVAGNHYTSSRALLECRDVVPPMHRQLICALTPIKKEMSSSVQYKMDFEMVQGKQAQAKSQPPISTADIHAAQPRACPLAKGKVLTLAGTLSPEDEVPYSKWENGGYVTSHDGAFGGAQKHTDESIDAMLQDFLALVGASSPAST